MSDAGGGRRGAVTGPGRSPENGPGVELGPDEGTWIESREGMLFFANAVLVAPELFVLLPLALRLLLDPLTLHGRPSVMLDTIPAVAAHVLPAVGWLLVIPLGLTAHNLDIEDRRWPRAALKVFLVLHIGFLAYTIASWLTG